MVGSFHHGDPLSIYSNELIFFELYELDEDLQMSEHMAKTGMGAPRVIQLSNDG